MKRFHLLIGGIALGCIFFLALPVWVVWNGKKAVYPTVSDAHPTSVGIVFGAGLTVNGDPSDALMDRLRVAAELYEQEKISQILVSGDNRFESYNEPEVMANTLKEEFQIPEAQIHIDYAGRRTYDTCVRAHDLWGVEHAILVTQGYHLPRAIWTCAHLGIESAGVSASLQPYILSTKFKIREVLAIYKALIDIYLFAPDYLGGEFITDLDP
jgi:SanA protein